MELTGWGKYPSIESEVITPLNISDINDLLLNADSNSLITRGLGRSYGDSSLAPQVISTAYLDHFLRFDEDSGNLTCSAGVSLADIIQVFVPKGWFLPVTPGTKFVTIGGAVASDVHGKNHHIDGSISDHIISMRIATISDGIIKCSREHHSELFYATCGGMGLTGVILEATIKMVSIQSAYINETTIKAPNLKEALLLIEKYKERTYSVAWIDCLSSGTSLGRSLLMLGEHSDRGDFRTGKSGQLTVPVDMPGFLLNRYSIQALNSLYYRRIRKQQSAHVVHYEPYFYPLDGIHEWNRLYGKSGFTQYQFVLPKDAGLEGMSEVLKRIAESKRGSFLAVLKAFGKGNNNYLSFPMEGYTLALDFKLDKGLFNLLNELDSIVLDYSGRLYLSKDARMSETMFKQSYPRWTEFMEVRSKYGADQVFNSLQSQRLGI